MEHLGDMTGDDQAVEGQPPAAGPAPPTPDATGEAQAIAYLKAHPDLLSQHPLLLEHLELQHAAGSAVSLIERQVEVLRGKNSRLEARLDRLVESARANEKRADGVFRLARGLIRSPSLASIVQALRASMREDFDIPAVFIGINHNVYKRHDIEGVIPLEPNGQIARAFDNFIRTRIIECGPIPPEGAALLFPKAAEPVRSAAIVPLEKEKNLGMLGLGSPDPERFQARQGKLFLEMTADLVAAAVRTRVA